MSSFNKTSNIYHMKKSWNFAENQHNYLLIKQYRKMNNQTYSFCACNSSPSCTVSNVTTPSGTRENKPIHVYT